MGTGTTNTGTAPALSRWIREWMERELSIAAADLNADRTFVQYGMDSVHAMMLVGDLEEHLGRRLSPTLAWDHPTVERLAAHLAQASAPTLPAQADAEPDADALLAQLDDMSEEDIDRLLARQDAAE